MGNKVSFGDRGSVLNFTLDAVTGLPVVMTSTGGVPTSAIAKATSGGTSSARVMSPAATTNPTVVKAAAGQIYGIELANAAAAAVYLKLYDKATAPTVGTDVPVRTIRIPAGQRLEISRPLGFPFVNGISYAITTGPLDADTTAVAISDLIGSIDYA